MNSKGYQGIKQLTKPTKIKSYFKSGLFTPQIYFKK